MSKRENDEKRLSIEFLRLLNIFTDYLDKSTLATAFMFLGMVLIGITPILYAAELLDLFNLVALVVNGGVIIIYGSYFYKRLVKRRLERYLVAVSSETLLGDSEYRGYAEDLERRLDRKLKELISVTSKREKEIESLKHEKLNLQIRCESLYRKLKELERGKKEGES